VRHDIRCEELARFDVIPSIAGDQYVDPGVLVLADQVDGLGHGTDEAAQWSAGGQPLALRGGCGGAAG